MFYIKHKLLVSIINTFYKRLSRVFKELNFIIKALSLLLFIVI
jgi:hypothetical protein